MIKFNDAGMGENGAGYSNRRADRRIRHFPGTSDPTKERFMSTDAKVTADIMKTLENGRLGYERAADRVQSEHPEIASKLNSAASERGKLYDELQHIASSYGDQIEENGSITGALHRGWITVRDALSSSDPKAVLEAAKTGEDHAIEEYEEALNTDVSPEFRPVLLRQLASVQGARSSVTTMLSTLN
jgi:uncharacterized protein (TIGR02284 family)